MAEKNKKSEVRLGRLRSEFSKSYGDSAVRFGSDAYDYEVIPTGILSLDYALGTGGWPMGFIASVYGPRDIGKTNMIAMNAVREAQNMGLIPVVVAVEPGFNDPSWMEKHGVDPEQVLVLHPETGEEAVEMAIKIARSGDADLMIFDSLGALLSEDELEADGKNRVGGQSGLITRLVKAVAPAAYRNRMATILLNQIRDNMASPVPGAVRQPGGHGLEHMSPITVRLRYGKGGINGYKMRENGEEVTIGRQIVALIERNKFTEGSNQKATFDFYIKDTGGENPFGVDTINDVVNTGKRAGAIKQSGPYYTLPDGTKLQGLKAVEKHLSENPDAYTEIRESVMKVLEGLHG